LRMLLPVFSALRVAASVAAPMVGRRAGILKVTPEQVTRHVRDGELAYVNVGRGGKRPRMRFTEADLTEFIERRKRRCTDVRLQVPEIALLPIRLCH
jgi:hypothetical protein